MATDAVSYDGSTFRIRGKRVLILAGSVHYIRVHPSRWSRLFESFREAHLNTIETYVFWGEHQPAATSESPEEAFRQPQYDFSGHRDLFGFLQAAHEAGLHAILRIGPYVCAEVSYGGFPFVLRDVSGVRFRTLNKPFQDAVAGWLRFMARELHERKLLAPAGGPVMMVQLENEYQMVAGSYGDDGARYLQWCSNIQHELNFGVPTIMCFGAAEGAVETINSFYAHEEVDALRKSRPNQPLVWTECWTGWYDVWGAPHHRRPAVDLAGAVARFFAVGGSGVNYYMWMGGTNFGRTPMYLQTTSYDYDAPIDEFYQPTTKSNHLTELHKVLKDRFAPVLCGNADNEDSEHAAPRELSVSEDVRCYVWSPGLAFVCNDSKANEVGDLGIPDIDMTIRNLAPRSVQIVDPEAKEVLFDSARINPEHVVSRGKRVCKHTPAELKWETRAEPVVVRTSQDDASTFQPRVARVAPSPVEQLRVTQDASDYCYYSASYKWASEDAASLVRATTKDDASKSPSDTRLCIAFTGCDFAYVFVNGHACGMSAEPLWEDRKSNKWNRYDAEPGFEHRISIPASRMAECLSTGSPSDGDMSFTITVLMCAVGLVKGDWQLGEGETANMLEEKKGLLSDVRVELAGEESGKGVQVANRSSAWTCVAGLEGEARDWHGTGGLGVAGTAVAASDAVDERSLAWFETKFQVDAPSNSWVLDLGTMGKGLLWVNGHLLGRYWLVAGTRPRNGFLDDSPIVQDASGPPSQRYYHVPAWTLRPEDPTTLRVTLFEERAHACSVAKVSLLEVD